MSPQMLELFERRLCRLHEEHGIRLLFQDNEALQMVDIRRKPTISEAYERLLGGTALALSEYCDKVRLEVLQLAEETVSSPSIEDRELILKVASSKFDASLYLKRFDFFGEAICRHFGRAGGSIQLQEYRTDLYRARQHAGTSTTISRFLASLNDDLELLIQRKQRVAAGNEGGALLARPHWTAHWGFWFTAVATIAGVAATYRAFVPAPATTGAAAVEPNGPSVSAPASGSRAASQSTTQPPRKVSAPR